MANLKEICKSKARGFITDPKKLVRYVVLLICCVVVIFQLSECFTKLYRPPITTHSHFDLNETVSYPAVTFCRDPPYKEDVLRAHNLSYHPKFSNAWRNFDFNSVDLKELFEAATYGKSEFFGQYGLDGLADNVEIVSGIYFNYGQCHTMSPKVSTRRSWKAHGYSLILTHTMEQNDETNSENSPGWHVFIHEEKENFTAPAGGLQFEDLDLEELAELTEHYGTGFDVFAYIKTLDYKLRKWAIDNNIRLCALSQLLQILNGNGHPSLPVDARTILRTPKKVNVFKMGSGECWYGGLKDKLTKLCKNKNGSDLIELNIHIDGTPIYKSSKSEFWPIQCSVKGIDMKAFFLQIFKGSSKPDSAELFMRPFLNEMHEFLASGLPVTRGEFNTIFEVRIDKFILDAPARAFLKCIIGHAGYYSCERCEEKGEYLCKEDRKVTKKKKSKNAGHVCLIGTDAPLRTDESFREQANPQHHHDDSPLAELPIDMVLDIPLEYLHLILYGCMKRLLTLWVTGTKNFKFSDKDIEDVSKKHIQAGITKPSEINKPNRSLKVLSFWKATEFRTFLLKTGPVALHGSLPDEMYNHFLALHCGVTICCSEPLKNYLPVAKCLFRTFSEKFGDIYGDENHTYSTHSVIHVTDDVERFGVFDNYSAFPGESNLGFLKNLVRGGHMPLQQVLKRIAERDSLEKVRQYEEMQDIANECVRKNVLRMQGLRLDSSEKNRWLLTKNKEIFKVEAIHKNGNEIVLEGAILSNEYENYYELPIESKNLFIFKSKTESTPLTIILDDFFCKLYRLEIDDENSVFFPLFHYTQ